MDISKNVSTAQDLFELLKQIPEAQRERLPLMIITPGYDSDNDDINAYAYEGTETQGNIVRGLQIIAGDC